MADFSKQWCDINDPEMPYDFDIIEEHSKLQPGYSIPWICEGFGFLMIGKGHNNEILLAMSDDNDFNTINWVDYYEFIENYNK